MNRAQVVERLSLGRIVEAEAPVDVGGRRKFIEVRPLIDESVAELKRTDVFVEPVLSKSTPNADVVLGYQVRLCTLNPGWEAYPDDWDHFVHNQEWYKFDSLSELEQALPERFSVQLEELQIPGKTESPL